MTTSVSGSMLFVSKSVLALQVGKRKFLRGRNPIGVLRAAVGAYLAEQMKGCELSP